MAATIIDPRQIDEARLIDMGPVPAFYVDGIAMVEISGPNFRAVFFEFRTIAGKRVKVPVAEIIQPIANYRPLRLQELIVDAQPPAACSLAH